MKRNEILMVALGGALAGLAGCTDPPPPKVPGAPAVDPEGSRPAPAAFLFRTRSGRSHWAMTTVLSLANLDCATCGEDLARAMIHEPGVYKTAFDRRKVELTVVADPSVPALGLALRKKPASEDFTIALGAGRGDYVAWTKPPAGADVKRIATNGEDIPDLAPHLAPGKVTVFDFSATWCEPCRKLDEHVNAMIAARGDVAYRKLDVGDWDTPLGLRYLKGVKELPYVIVFDPKGRRVEALTGLDLARFDQAVDRAARAR